LSVSPVDAIRAKAVVIPECGLACDVLRRSAANIRGRPLPYVVAHISEFMAQLKRDDKLKLRRLDESITYHDHCQISRRDGAQKMRASSCRISRKIFAR